MSKKEKMRESERSRKRPGEERLIKREGGHLTLLRLSVSLSLSLSLLQGSPLHPLYFLHFLSNHKCDSLFIPTLVLQLIWSRTSMIFSHLLHMRHEPRAEPFSSSTNCPMAPHPNRLTADGSLSASSGGAEGAL